MAMLSRLFARNAPMPLPKQAPVVAVRDLGEYPQGLVRRGTAGIVSAVSRVGTYEVTFHGQVRLTNLDHGDIGPYAREATATTSCLS